jgi:exopolyphosphatase/guanosine-5'-triphosphate,3'-diphosphate pyrophosphatase
MTKIAVIDSGTNTSSLIIFELLADNSFRKIVKESFYVQMAENGIETISNAAIERVKNAYLKFAEIISEHKVEHIKAIGTAAFRVASNGAELAEEVYNCSAIQIEVIDGKREAELIFAGVSQTLPNDGLNNLIIDIGGGSVEFMIGNRNQCLWRESFQLGAALLSEKFKISDPIHVEEIRNLSNYIQQKLQPLSEAVSLYPVHRLVAASGTLDALANLLGIEFSKNDLTTISATDFNSVLDKIIFSSYEQRLEMPNMMFSRAKLLPIALILFKAVLKNNNIAFPIYLSANALHEGILVKILSEGRFFSEDV